MGSDLTPAPPATAGSGPEAAADWHRDDPRYDRAAGVWLGAAAAACMVGAPPEQAAGLVGADGGAGSSEPARLLESALAGAGGPVGTAAGAFARAVGAAVAEGRVPEPAGAADGEATGAAWRAVAETPVPDLDPAGGRFPCRHLVESVWRAWAVAGDQAALYAGALAGARWGASGVPLEAQRRLCDTLAPSDLITRGIVLARGGDPDRWPQAPAYRTEAAAAISTPFHTAHPGDPGVVLGNLSYLRQRPSGVDAVVSLNRLGPGDLHTGVAARDRIQVWLADSPGVNANLYFVLEEAAGLVAALRAEGKTVLLHCAAGQSRTPAVAAHYAARSLGADVRRALTGVIGAVGGHLDNPELARTVCALNGVGLDDAAAELFPGGLPQRR
ncbi:hypothetical protein GCM10027570_27220 [Streptomonospora sediminis]